MNRILVAIILSLWIMFLGAISYGIGDYDYIFETWICVFSLPIWSLMTIGLWYDTGRLLFGLNLDFNESKISTLSRSMIFITWMSVIFTYIFWTHMSLQVIPMLIVIPIIGIPLRDWLVQNWNEPSALTIKQFTALFIWGTMSYATYWILTIIWILIRVFVFELTNDGFVYYIQ